VRPLPRELCGYGQRFAPYAALRFTDEEVVTLYWCGILDGKCPIKTLYEPARRYWRDGCPHLPRYGGFVQRLNRLADVFPALLDHWSPAGALASLIGVADAFPVVLAQQGRRFTAKVAKDLAANLSGGPVLEPIAPSLGYRNLYADKAYADLAPVYGLHAGAKGARTGAPLCRRPVVFRRRLADSPAD
jgi:hypothetical protein